MNPYIIKMVVTIVVKEIVSAVAIRLERKIMGRNNSTKINNTQWKKR